MSIREGKVKNWGSRSGKTARASSGSRYETLSLGELSSDLLSEIANGSESLKNVAREIIAGRERVESGTGNKPALKLETKLGRLYQGDCITFLKSMKDETLDCIFADPPFNLQKNYDGSGEDNLPEHEYLEWTRTWLNLCSDKLKDGGSFFIYNIPKWGIPIASFLSKKINFKHWIAVDITFSMPIPGRLYPSHYSLLYFVKGGKPNVFNPPRIPIKTCVRCGQEQNDYGGYKMKMNPKGVNIRDVWTDIPPVRHAKHKSRDANQLHVKLLDRVLDIATNEGDLVFDPFGGAGTTFVVAEMKNRKWVGTELGDCAPILDRFASLSDESAHLERYRKDINTLFTDKALQLRVKSGLPIDNYRIEEEQLRRVSATSQRKLPGLDL